VAAWAPVPGRLQAWTEAGVWLRLHELVLKRRHPTDPAGRRGPADRRGAGRCRRSPARYPRAGGPASRVREVSRAATPGRVEPVVDLGKDGTVAVDRWASAARRRWGTTPASSSPLIMSGSRRQSKLLPSTAAAPESSRMPGTAAIRRRTVSANVTGTATPNERSSVQPSASSAAHRPAPSPRAALRPRTADRRPTAPAPRPARRERAGRPDSPR
jgi:hypothetical protein